MGSVLNEALKLVRAGICLVPLFPKSKIPIIQDYYNKAFRTEDDVRAYWSTGFSASHGVGIAIMKDTPYIGVDFDFNHGATDDDLKKFPRTWTVKTRRGFHLYYKRPTQEISGGALVAIDDGRAWNQQPAVLYVDGRQFVAPPTVVSMEKVGGVMTENDPFEYRWHSDPGGELSPFECELADVPEFFFRAGNPGAIRNRDVEKARLVNPPAPTNTNLDAIGKYGPNHRHNMLLRTATKMRANGADAAAIEERLMKRAAEDCDPPKPMPEIISEVKGLVEWAMAKVPVRPTKFQQEETESYVIPVGFRDDDYYYTSSSNRQIVRIKDSAHSSKLLALMPMEYWLGLGYKSKEGGVAYQRLASDLMNECRQVGIFDEKKTRGIGCWKDEGRLVLHLGDTLLVDDAEMPINRIGSDYIYALGPALDYPHAKPLAVAECKPLVELCKGLDWVNPGSGVLLAGGMAAFRICGALDWRPHFWLTSPRGSGKSTIIKRLVNVIAGKWGVFVEGDSSEAGIRQEVRHQAIPITYDEAETENKSSHNRMQRILSLARQASTDTEGRILKGTVDGRGMNFKINASFFLGSINVNLQNEADKSRFTILDLKRGDRDKWPAIRKLYDPITKEFADRLFSRALSLYPVLMKNREMFENLIAEKTDRRTGQQYGILLAGYALLHTDGVVSEADGRRVLGLVPQLSGGEQQTDEEPDEKQCLDQLLQSFIDIEESSSRRRITVMEAVSEARGSGERCVHLQRYGLDVSEGFFLVRASSPPLVAVFRDTKWASGWSGSLSRLQGAKNRHTHRFLGVSSKCVKIPLVTIFDVSK